MIPNKPSFTVTEAARIAGITRPTIYKAMDDGSLRHWRTWKRGNPRINRDALLEYLGRKPEHSSAA